tara:strand:+ start:356 stop:1207 length:852 start_codon:yes stop_codon:yes gene_type:complete
MKKKINSIAGVTLIEILIGIVISTVMMAAMYTSYNIVNSTYSQVTDTAKISSTGRDVVGMIIRDIRMAGYKYFNDNIQIDVVQHIPILITKRNSSNPCDKIDIVHGDIKYDTTSTPPTYTFERIKITYYCKLSDIIDKKAPAAAVGGTLPTIGLTEGVKAIYKSKVKWDSNAKGWADPNTDGDSETYNDEPIVEYIEDLIFIPIDENGKIINPPPSSTANSDKVYSIKVVDIMLSVRSKKDFFKNMKTRIKKALVDDTRKISKNDKYLRDTIIVSAHARNLGL